MSRHTFSEFEDSGDYLADLRRRLEQAGVSHGEMSRRMEVTASEFSRWINARIIPGLDTVIRIERAFAEIQEERGAGKRPARRKRGR